MNKAVRAIILNGDQMLVMHRYKHGSEYFTLVGGRVKEGENLDAVLEREVKEETSLDIIEAKLVFIEKHPDPYNEQYIYMCKVKSTDNAAISAGSEEAILNTTVINIHTLRWINIRSLDSVQFRTPQLQAALIRGFKNGFPEEVQTI
jgi:ADP-ribose pyrophosphatase YjhB (NUDIX family)